MSETGTVHILEDDAEVSRSLRFRVESYGLRVKVHKIAELFPVAHDLSSPGCLLLDVRLPDLTGLEIQAQLGRHGNRMPIIMISEDGGIDEAVRAMKGGAFDFIQSPHLASKLLACIRKAFALDEQRSKKEVIQMQATKRIALLTPRELEVMHLLIAGEAPQRIAQSLGISRKTVNVHRGHIVTKLEVSSPVEMLRMAQVQAGERKPDSD